MRFVAQSFVKLMEKYPFLETSAFIVIGVLGLKLMLALPAHYFHESAFFQFTESEKFDLFISILTVSIFLAPVITSYIFNLPGRKK